MKSMITVLLISISISLSAKVTSVKTTGASGSMTYYVQHDNKSYVKVSSKNYEKALRSLILDVCKSNTKKQS